MSTICNPENMRKFVDALRSGEYQQATSQLGREGIGYCCLGVACVVAQRNGVPITLNWSKWGMLEVTEPESFNPENRESLRLPLTVQEWLGIDSSDPIILNDNINGSASYCNDKLHWNFYRIADAFEKKYLGVVDD